MSTKTLVAICGDEVAGQEQCAQEHESFDDHMGVVWWLQTRIQNDQPKQTNGNLPIDGVAPRAKVPMHTFHPGFEQHLAQREDVVKNGEV